MQRYMQNRRFANSFNETAVFFNEIPLRLTLPFDIIFHVEVLPIKDSIGERLYPVTEDEHAYFLAEHQVEFDVPVPVKIIVDIGMRLHIFFCVGDKVFLIFTHVG